MTMKSFGAIVICLYMGSFIFSDVEAIANCAAEAPAGDTDTYCIACNNGTVYSNG